MPVRRLVLGAIVAVAACKSGGGSNDGLTPVGDSGVRIKIPPGAKLELRGDHYSCSGGGCSAEIRLHDRMPTSSSLDSEIREAQVIGDLDPRVETLPSGLVVFSVTGNPSSSNRSGMYFVKTWLPEDSGSATSCYGTGNSPTAPGIVACKSLTSTKKLGTAKASAPSGPSAPPPAAPAPAAPPTP